MAPLRTPRTSWIQAGLQALSEGGPDAVRVEALAERLGVTKGGFYGQFHDRRALLDAMLDAWEQLVIDSVIDQVERGGGTAPDKLWRLFTLAAASPLSEQILRTELAVRDWARHDPAVAARVQRVDTRRVEYMRPLFREICASEADVEARCLLVFSLFVGSHFVVVDHGSSTRAEVLQTALKQLLEPGA
jgi:AcrR family transcriptional regulator